VLSEKPTPLHTLRDTVPDGVERVVLTALAKLPADRFATARAFIDALEATSGEPARGVSASRTSLRRTPTGLLAAVALSCVAAIATSVGWWREFHRIIPTAFAQFSLTLPDGAHVVNGQASFSLSTDGRMVAMATESRDGKRLLYLRALSDANAVPLAGTDGGDQPAFSPDGAWIAFVAGNQLKKVRTAGGDVATLAEVGDTQGLSWGSAGLIFLANDGRLAVVPENGGSLRLLPESSTPKGSAERYPIALPDGKSVIFTLWPSGLVGAHIMRRTIEPAPATSIGVDSAMALGIVHGWIVSGGSGGVVSAAPLNDGATRVTGPARQIFQGVALMQFKMAAAVAPNGTFVYLPGAGLSDLVLLQPGGDTTLVTTERRDYQEPRLSPDGKRIATVVIGRNGTDLLVIDRDTRAITRLTTDGWRPGRPEWTPDGKRLVYRAFRDSLAEIHSRRSDGSDAPVRLQEGSRLAAWEAVVSPNGDWLLYRTGTLATADIFYRRLSGDTTSHAFIATPSAELEGRFSPDGKWVSYTSAESAVRQVFVRPFPTSDMRVQVSVNGGEQAVWSADGHSLYYSTAQGGVLIRAKVSLSPTFAVTSRDTVLRGGFDMVPRNGHASYDVAADGRLLLVRRLSASTPPVVALGWFDHVHGAIDK